VGLTLYLSLGGLALVFASVVGMYVIVFQMIRVVNRNPGAEGWIPLWSMLTRTAYLYHPIQRYRAQNGKDSLYRTLQICWVIFGAGLASVIGGSLAEHFSHS
jgi:hypothetical protein